MSAEEIQKCLETAVAAMRDGKQSWFFSLEYGPEEISRTFTAIDEQMSEFEDRFRFDCSDDICATYIIACLADAPAGTVVIVDYLQLLDQRRLHPDLAAQIADLRAFAAERGLILLFVSQIQRQFDPQSKPVPDLTDVHLPNPLDLSMFSRTCFLHEGELEIAAVSQRP